MSETPEQMHNRLNAVMAAARFEPLPQPYAWQRVDTLLKLPSGALASVRDCSTWYALAPASPEAAGVYRILVFHFAEGNQCLRFRCMVSRTHEDRSRNRRDGSLRLRRTGHTGAVANVARPVRLLGLSLGLRRGRDCSRGATTACRDQMNNDPFGDPLVQQPTKFELVINLKRQGTRPRSTADAARARRRGDRMTNPILPRHPQVFPDG
jgi:hypothetical protein